MSSTASPISAHQFTEAIQELPLANLHFKAAEIRNSIAHLQSSNQQLQPFADDGDVDCKESIEENALVIQRMEDRVSLLRREVEGRGFKWGEDELENEGVQMNGHGETGSTSHATATGTTSAVPARERNGGGLGDEELARRLAERMEEDDDEDGVHL